MTQSPPITIGLPVYNGERYLGAAIDSILAQTSRFVMFVSDNASTDSTSELVQEYARRDARVVFSRSPQNRGAIWNFNHVFAECRSPPQAAPLTTCSPRRASSAVSRRFARRRRPSRSSTRARR